MYNTNLKLIQTKNSLFILLIPLLIISCVSNVERTTIEYIKTKANIWHLESYNHEYFATADYDGNISKRDKNTGELLWEYPSGAFVFDLKVGDIDQDGEYETAVVTAEGDLVILDSNGNRIWSFHSKLPLYNVGIGNFTGDNNLEITCGGIDRYIYVFDNNGHLIEKSLKVERLVHRIAVGNLIGDDYDEILVIENKTVANLMGFKNDSLISFWRKQLKVSDDLINWENPRGNFFHSQLKLMT